MINLESNLVSALDRCDGLVVDDEAYDKGFSKIYPFLTENISGYIDSFDLENKSLLTVGSSGDQALNAIPRNCKDVTVMDINPYAKYYYYLKAAGIIELTKEEFLRFFRYLDYPKKFRNNQDVFNKKDYEKIKKNLSKFCNGRYS